MKINLAVVLVLAASVSGTAMASENLFVCNSVSAADKTPVTVKVFLQAGQMKATIAYTNNGKVVTDSIPNRVYYVEPVTTSYEVQQMAQGAQAMGVKIDPAQVVRYQEINLGADTDLGPELIVFFGPARNDLGGNSDRPSQNVVGMYMNGYTATGVCN